MRTVGILVVYSHAFATASMHRFVDFVRNVDSNATIILVQNNPQLNLLPPANVIVLNGDNILHEFGAWQLGLDHARTLPGAQTLQAVVLANDTFCHHHPMKPLENLAFTLGLRRLLVESRALGCGDVIATPSATEDHGVTMERWIVTYLFAMNRKALAAIDWQLHPGMERLQTLVPGGTDEASFFSEELDWMTRERWTAWMFGRPGRHRWRRSAPLSASNATLMRDKAYCVVSERWLSLHLQERGADIVNVYEHPRIVALLKLRRKVRQVRMFVRTRLKRTTDRALDGEQPGLRIAYRPSSVNEDLYVQRMREVITRFGTVVEPLQLKALLSQLLRGRWIRYDAMVLNWSDTDFLTPAARHVGPLKTVQVALAFLATHLFARRVVMVRHSVHSHAAASFHQALAARLSDCIEKLCSHVVVHSGNHQEEGRRHYCPHPLYRPIPQVTHGSHLQKQLAEIPPTYFVVLGDVARHRRILELAQQFPSDRALLIVGPCRDPDYGEELARLQRPNVFYRPSSLSEEDAQIITHNSCGVVISHQDDAPSISESFFHAVSSTVPVLAIETPFLRWIAPSVGPDMLVLCRDVSELARAVGEFRQPTNLERSRQHIERGFGDEAIVSALRPVFDQF